MPRRVHDIIRQRKRFASIEQEVAIALQIAASRTLEPWVQRLKAAGLTANQYNVLRILRGAEPDGLPCSDIASRMISKDPDITRLVDRLVKSGLARRRRGTADRRVVRVFITDAGLEVLAGLEVEANAMPVRTIGGLGGAKLKVLLGLLEEAIECASVEGRAGAVTQSDKPGKRGGRHG